MRRLERAHSVQHAGKTAVPTGLPAIDALLPDGGLLTGALHEVEAGPAPSGRVAAHDGAALGFAAHLMGRFAARTAGTLLWCRRPSGVFDAACARPRRLVRSARLLMVTARRDEGVFWAMRKACAAPASPPSWARRGPPTPLPAVDCRSPPRRAACLRSCCGPSPRRRKACA
jgi:protein ImuA